MHATIRNSSISHNMVRSSNTAGDANGFGGGIGVDGSLDLISSGVDHNHVLDTVPAGSTAGAFGDSGGIGMGGYASISDSRLTRNSVTARAPGGTASAMFAALSSGNSTYKTVVIRSVISDNLLRAVTTTGSLVLQGAGIGHLNGGGIALKNDTIVRNVAQGSGGGGIAQGGGVWNGRLDPSSTLGPLRIGNTLISRNILKVSSGITAQGGGVFTAVPPTIRGTTISGNKPDQCHGC